MSDNIEERVNKVIFDDYLSCLHGELKIEQEEIREDHHLFDDMNMDSFFLAS
jgi:hypothetical protein